MCGESSLNLEHFQASVLCISDSHSQSPLDSKLKLEGMSKEPFKILLKSPTIVQTSQLKLVNDNIPTSPNGYGNGGISKYYLEPQ